MRGKKWYRYSIIREYHLMGAQARYPNQRKELARLLPPYTLFQGIYIMPQISIIKRVRPYRNQDSGSENPSMNSNGVPFAFCG